MGVALDASCTAVKPPSISLVKGEENLLDPSWQREESNIIVRLLVPEEEKGPPRVVVQGGDSIYPRHTFIRNTCHTAAGLLG
jgi:hypothetical protein